MIRMFCCYQFDFSTQIFRPNLPGPLLGSLFVEAGVIGIICILFLILFIVAGIRQMLKEKDQE